MVKYTVEVFTGDAFTAGNANAVFIKLIGTKGSSEPQILDRFAGIQGCSVSFLHFITIYSFCTIALCLVTVLV